jgi:hypothetical protein
MGTTILMIPALAAVLICALLVYPAVNAEGVR